MDFTAAILLRQPFLIQHPLILKKIEQKNKAIFLWFSIKTIDTRFYTE